MKLQLIVVETGEKWRRALLRWDTLLNNCAYDFCLCFAYDFAFLSLHSGHVFSSHHEPGGFGIGETRSNAERIIRVHGAFRNVESLLCDSSVKFNIWSLLLHRVEIRVPNVDRYVKHLIRSFVCESWKYSGRRNAEVLHRERERGLCSNLRRWNVGHTTRHLN